MDAREDDLRTFWASLGLGPVAVAHAGERCVALPAVTDHNRGELHVGLDEARERGPRRIGNHLKPDATRSAAPDFDGTDNERSVAQLAPTSRSFLIADVRLIHFHLAAQRLSPGPEHCPAQFLEHRPGRFVAVDAELTLKLERRHPRRVRGDQVGRPEPLPQRRACTVQHRAGCHRGLMAARLALPEMAVRQLERVRVPAPGASVPVRPAGSGEVGTTRRLVGKPGLKLGQRCGEGRPRHRQQRYPWECSESTG